MAARRRPHQILTAVLATCTAAALVAGCGGSEINEAGPEVADALIDTAPGAVDGGASVTETGATSGEPAQRSKAGLGSVPAGAQAPAGADVDATGTNKLEPGRKGGASGEDRGNRAVSSSAGGSAVANLVAGHPIFGGSNACRPATLSEIPLGNVSTFSGVLGELLSPVRPALETWVASQNACGGLNGHKIKIYFEDDQSDPSTAIAKVQGLIQQQKVLAFVGNIQPLSIDAVIPTINKYRVPIIGGDLVSNTWFQNPLLFPQGASPGGVAYGYLLGATKYHKKNVVGDMWCIEVPRACEQIDRAFKDLAPQFGATVKKSAQVSLTAPSFVQQCLDFKNAGVEAVALIVDAATMARMARSCEQVGYFPKLMPTPLGVGNEKQFLNGNKWLGNSYVAMNYFPWFANETPAQKYWHASVKKYNPGFPMGGAASTGWTAGALLVAAAAELSPTHPTTADLLRGLYSFNGQKFTELGGLTPPLTYRVGKVPKVPYCLFAGISNADNTGWAKAIAKAECTDVVAVSDPQKNS